MGGLPLRAADGARGAGRLKPFPLSAPSPKPRAIARGRTGGSGRARELVAIPWPPRASARPSPPGPVRQGPPRLPQRRGVRPMGGGRAGGGCTALPVGSGARWPRSRRRIYEWRERRAEEVCERGGAAHVTALAVRPLRPLARCTR